MKNNELVVNVNGGYSHVTLDNTLRQETNIIRQWLIYVTKILGFTNDFQT